MATVFLFIPKLNLIFFRQKFIFGPYRLLALPLWSFLFQFCQFYPYSFHLEQFKDTFQFFVKLLQITLSFDHVKGTWMGILVHLSHLVVKYKRELFPFTLSAILGFRVSKKNLHLCIKILVNWEEFDSSGPKYPFMRGTWSKLNGVGRNLDKT